MIKKTLGIDNGYSSTKTSEGVCILSTAQVGHDDYNNNTLEINVNDINYIVGEETAQYVVDANKFETEESKQVLRITTLAAIGLSYPTETLIDINLIAGLPVAYYADQKVNLEILLRELDGSTIEINKLDKKQVIKINDVMILPQAAPIIIEKNKSNETSLVIDIGGGTIDVAEFDGLKLNKKATYERGMLVLYSGIAQALNSKYYTNFEASDIQNIRDRKFFTVKGEKKDTQEIEEYLRSEVRKITTTIKRDFDTTSVDNLYVFGGGAIALKDYIKEYFPASQIENNCQFTNVNSFAFLGELKLMQNK